MSASSIVLPLVLCVYVSQLYIVRCEECIKGQLDILFLFDSSSTAGSDNFTRSLQFASNLAENFHIGSDGVQFSASSFSDSPVRLFNLNTYTDFHNIEKAIVSAQYLSGNTNTHLALENANTFFDQSQGGRVAAPKVVVLFTSGKSADGTRTQQQAQSLKSTGVFVIVVGLSNSNTQELQAIASNSSVVFSINNFNEVLQFLQDYSNDACSQAVNCAQGLLDILFLIDASSNVDAKQFTQELGVSANLAENFPIGPKAVQFSAVTFADMAHNLFDFNAYTNFSGLEAAILQAQYMSGNTNTFLAFENSRDLFFGSHGARDNAAKVALIFSNGRSADPARTQQQASMLKSYGVYVLSVAVSNVSDSELQAMSSSHDVLHINDFDGILQALQDYYKTACSKVPCIKGTLDLLYVFDASTSVGASDFDYGLRFAANLAENFHIGVNGTQVGAISFADSTHRLFTFTTYSSFTDLQKAILNITYLTGSANIPLALEDSRNFFGVNQGARVGAPKVALIFTGGNSGDSAKTSAQATALKQAGVHVIVVAYPEANLPELQTIASEGTPIFNILDFTSVLTALQDYSSNACNKD